jgi:hypothetical protein
VLHLRFENPGNDQIRSFHLTDEGGMTRLNPRRIDEDYDMRGHLFSRKASMPAAVGVLR